MVGGWELCMVGFLRVFGPNDAVADGEAAEIERSGLAHESKTCTAVREKPESFANQMMCRSSTLIFLDCVPFFYVI